MALTKKEIALSGFGWLLALVFGLAMLAPKLGISTSDKDLPPPYGARPAHNAR